MNRDALDALVRDTLAGIAPEISPGTLEADTPLRDQVDLDSMDWLRYLTALSTATGVEIPERDYARLKSLTALVDYLDQGGRAAASQAGPR